MSFEKLKKGLHVYFGVVIFMVLLFSVCGMVDKNSNSSSSNDVSKTESGLIGTWGRDDRPGFTLEIKSGTIELKGTDSETGEIFKIEIKIKNIDSTAKNLTTTLEVPNSSKLYEVFPYYLSADGKELVFGYSSLPLGRGVLWTKK